MIEAMSQPRAEKATASEDHFRKIQCYVLSANKNSVLHLEKGSARSELKGEKEAPKRTVHTPIWSNFILTLSKGTPCRRTSEAVINDEC